jgi:hypothetical protein
MTRSPRGPKNRCTALLHAEVALREVAVDVVVAGEETAGTDLGEPCLEVLAHGRLVVAGVDVHEVQARVGDARRRLDRRRAPDPLRSANRARRARVSASNASCWGCSTLATST